MHHRSRFGREIPPSPGARGRPLDQSLIGLQRCGRQLALPRILSTRFSLPASPLSPLSPPSPRLRPSHPNHFTARPVFGPYTSAARPAHDWRGTQQSPRTRTAFASTHKHCFARPRLPHLGPGMRFLGGATSHRGCRFHLGAGNPSFALPLAPAPAISQPTLQPPP